jgi:two-component sensor histidine kinase
MRGLGAVAPTGPAFEGTDDHSSEVRYRRKGGSKFCTALFISPVQDETSGDIIQYFASFIDLTKHKEEQAQSRMLIDELNHRVKNTLTTVQSIVSQGLRNTQRIPRKSGKPSNRGCSPCLGSYEAGKHCPLSRIGAR